MSSDLPVGQQSRSDLETRLRLELGRAFVQDFTEDEDCLTEWYPCEPSCGRCACSGQPYLSEKAWAAIGPVIAAVVARVRADVAEVIAVQLELRQLAQEELMQRRQGGQARECAIRARAFKAAAELAREHAVVPAESVVEAPTDPAPCHCHQSRAAVSPTHEGHCCFLPASQTCHPDEVAVWMARRTAVGALPEDEGTRQEGLINVEER